MFENNKRNLKVKLFAVKGYMSSRLLNELESSINAFLDENDIEVVDIKYTTTQEHDRIVLHSALLMYKENTEDAIKE